MKDPNCIFCKIVAGEIPSVKVWEDDNFLAILDINPNTEGATLVISKEHQSSDFLSLPEDVVSDFTKAAKKVADLLKEGLAVDRVMLVAEGMDVDHAHLKLYPLHEGDYRGYLTTSGGTPKTPEELEKVAQKIRG